MAARLISPYPLVWSTGLARAGVGCRGAVSDQVLAGRRGWARLGSPVDGGGRVRNPRRPSSRGFEESGSSSTQPESPGSHHCSRASTAARGRDADQGPNARQLGDGVGSILRDKSATGR